MPLAVKEPLFLVVAAYAISVASISAEDRPVCERNVVVGTFVPDTAVYAPVTRGQLERLR